MANASKESQARYHRIYIRLNPYEYNFFAKAKEELGLSAREVIEFLSQPCDLAAEMVIYNKKKTKSMPVQKGFLCKK